MKKLLLLIVSSLIFVGLAFGQANESPDESIQIPQMQPKKWAICIGVSNYTSLGKLNFGAKDCISFANTLEQELSFSKESIFVLADRTGYQTPDAKNVRATLDLILSRSALDSGDLFIVYTLSSASSFPTFMAAGRTAGADFFETPVAIKASPHTGHDGLRRSRLQRYG